MLYMQILTTKSLNFLAILLTLFHETCKFLYLKKIINKRTKATILNGSETKKYTKSIHLTAQKTTKSA